MNKNEIHIEKLQVILNKLDEIQKEYHEYQIRSEAILERQMDLLEKTITQVANMKAAYDNELDYLTNKVEMLEEAIITLKPTIVH